MELDNDYVCECHKDNWCTYAALSEHRAEHYLDRNKELEGQNAKLILKNKEMEEMMTTQYQDPREVKKLHKKTLKKERQLKKRERDLKEIEESLMKRAVSIRLREERLHMDDRELGRRVLALAELD